MTDFTRGELEMILKCLNERESAVMGVIQSLTKHGHSAADRMTEKKKIELADLTLLSGKVHYAIWDKISEEQDAAEGIAGVEYDPAA